MTIFTLDYAVLLIAFLIVAYKVLKASDDEDRNSDRKVTKIDGKTVCSKR